MECTVDNARFLDDAVDALVVRLKKGDDGIEHTKAREPPH